ncbi:MFS transporter [Ferroacidibacillus organovorans]|uniref:Major facilitator superfamily (MFS) profile domain-containing protein n=1 Tax=Ferroacidibacillus organovorans TaxID=1765683 RepID=A0A101XNY4_9BACL|nr:MFS transporter [Ferroacidibacillus organovorans]KUO94922.1 hypothetical protein ATW55_15475 [Ferroacidibacillus organovorans]
MSLFENIYVIRNKNAYYYLGANLLSMIGDWVYFVVVTAVLYKTGGLSSVALLSVIRQIPFILLVPVAGVIIDYYSRRKLVFISAIVSALSMLGLCFILWFNISNVWVIFLCVLVNALAGTISRPIQMAVMPKLVDTKSLLSLNTLSNVSGTVALIVGPMLASLFLAIHHNSVAFLFNLMVVLVLLSVMLLLPRSIYEINADSEFEISSMFSFKRVLRVLKDWKAVFVDFIHNDVMLTVLMFLLVNHIVVGAIWVLIPEMTRVTSVGSVGIGYMNTAVGVGSVVGALLGGWFGRKSLKVSTITGVIGMGLSVFLLSVTNSLFMIYVSFALIGLFANISDGPMWTILQNNTDDSNAGRVYSSIDSFTVL